jgi:hypothetical protein
MKMAMTVLGRRARAALVTALLLPYLLLQSVATGLMPAVTNDGLTFVICPGDAVVEAVLRPDGSYDFDTKDHADSRTCPWAVAHMPATLADAPIISKPLERPARLNSETFFAVFVPLPEGKSPPARGPPHYV